MSKAGKSNKKLYEESDLQNAKPENLKFALNLSGLMEAKGVDGEALASALGLKSSSSISMYRTGKQFPKSPVQLIKLADALDTTVDALIGNSKEMYVQDDDLMVYADAFGVSPVAISNMTKVSCGPNPSITALDAFLSHKDMKKLMDAIQEVLYKINYYHWQISESPNAPASFRDGLIELIHGKLYTTSKAFEEIMEDIVCREISKSINFPKESNNGETE